MVKITPEFRKDKCKPYLDGTDEAWVESSDETVGLVRLDYAVPETLKKIEESCSNTW